MDYKIRKLKQNEVNVLNTFLYEAIFTPDGVDAPPYEIIKQPELQVYVTLRCRWDETYLPDLICPSTVIISIEKISLFTGFIFARPVSSRASSWSA